MPTLPKFIQRLQHALSRLFSPSHDNALLSDRAICDRLHAIVSQAVRSEFERFESRSEAQIYTDEAGREWKPFAMSYSTPEGMFSLTFYAISFEHAHMVLDEIKQTAKLDGEILGIY